MKLPYSRTAEYRRLDAQRTALLNEPGGIHANRAALVAINEEIMLGYWRHANPRGGWRIANDRGEVISFAGVPAFQNEAEARGWIHANAPAGWADNFKPIFVPSGQSSVLAFLAFFCFLEALALSGMSATKQANTYRYTLMYFTFLLFYLFTFLPLKVCSIQQHPTGGILCRSPRNREQTYR